MKLWAYSILWSVMLCKVLGALELPTKYSEYDMANYACSGYIGAVATVCELDEEESLAISCLCGEDSGFGTMSQCLVQGYNNDSEIINGFITSCMYAGVKMTPETFYENYTRTEKLLKNVSTVEDFNMTKLVDYPVLLDMSNFRITKDSYRYFLNNYNLSIYFGSGLLGYWALVLLIASVVNWTIRLFPSLTNFFAGPFSNLHRKYVTLSAAIHKKKSHEHRVGMIFDCLVPSRMETLICVGFLAMTVAMLSAQMKRVDGGSIMYPTKVGELARYMGDRTGIVISFIVPLLVLFAGRNNFLQWVTRWNFATFITYHRWVSRIVVLVVFIHAITFSVSDSKAGKYKKRMKKPFMNWGVVATISGAIILVQGMMYFRRKSYETFLLIHIVFALFFIVGAYKHTVLLGYGAFYWATVAIWALDRVIRLFRLIAFGAPTATVTVLADETLKIVVPKPKYWKSIPGGHAFIHFLRPSCFWQSHPFTFTDSPNSESSIVLYVKIKGGVTHGVTQHLLKSPGRTAKMRVCVEGPYGEPSSARQYKNAVFVAGGNGIPGIYSECVDLAKRQNDRQSLKLVWIIREWKSLSWFFEELKRLQDTKVQTTVYVTRPDLTSEIDFFENIISSDSSSNELEKKSTNEEVKDKELDSYDREKPYNNGIINAIKSELSHINFQEGRPSMESMVEKEVTETDGSLAFVTCGHPVMVDDIRYSVIQNLDKTKYRVEYFEQLQVWA